MSTNQSEIDNRADKLIEMIELERDEEMNSNRSLVNF